MKIRLTAFLVIIAVLFSANAILAKPKTVNIDLVGADLISVIKTFAKEANCDVVIDQDVTGIVNMKLKDVPFDNALSVVLQLNGYDYRNFNDLLVVAKPARLKDLAASLATPPGTMVTQIIPLQYAAPQDISSTVTSTYPSVVVSVDTGLNAIIVKGSVGAIKMVKELVAKLDVVRPEIEVPELSTRVVGLKFITTENAQALIPTLLPGLDYKPDKRLNSLIVTGTETTFKKLDKVLAVIDVPLEHVKLEVKVVSISSSKTKNIGQAFGDNNISSFQTSLVEMVNTGNGYVTQGLLDLKLGGFFSFVRSPISTMNFAIQANLSQTGGEIIANPTVTTVSGQEASIESTRVFRYVYWDSQSGTYTPRSQPVGVAD
jgi:type II secretory pathway component GspD/PulD (secretin)